MAERTLSPEAQASLDAAMGIAPEPAAEPATDEAAPEPAESTASPEAPEAAGTPEPGPTPAPEPESSLAQLPELLRLKKQAERRAKEATESARAEVEKMKAELEELRAKVSKPLEDPVQFFREAGMNPLEVAQMIASAELPADKADPQARLRYQQMKQRHEAQSEVQKLREEIQEFKRQQEQQQQAQQYEKILADIRTEDQALLQNELAPDSLVHGLYKVNPDYALEQMLDFRRRYADAYPDEPIPSASQVAEQLEKQLESIGYAPPAPARTETSQQKQPEAVKGDPEPTLSSTELAGRTAKDKIPTDEEEFVKFMADQLRSGDYAR